MWSMKHVKRTQKNVRFTWDSKGGFLGLGYNGWILSIKAQALAFGPIHPYYLQIKKRMSSTIIWQDLSPKFTFKNLMWSMKHVKRIQNNVRFTWDSKGFFGVWWYNGWILFIKAQALAFGPIYPYYLQIQRRMSSTIIW